jgi:hypothetical protein
MRVEGSAAAKGLSGVLPSLGPGFLETTLRNGVAALQVER